MASSAIGEVVEDLVLADDETAYEALKEFYEWRQARWMAAAKGFGAASAAAAASTVAESLKDRAKDATEAPTWVMFAILGWAIFVFLVAVVVQYRAGAVQREYLRAVRALSARLQPPPPPPGAP